MVVTGKRVGTTGPPLDVAVIAVLLGTVLASEVGRWLVAAELGTAVLDHVATSLSFLTFAVIGALVVRRGEVRGYGWLLLAMGVVGSTQGVAFQYTALAWSGQPTGEWPLALLAAWYQDLWMLLWVLGFLLIPALFPDGRPPSARWQRAIRVTAVAWAIYIPLFMLVQRPISNFFEDAAGVETPANPTGVIPLPGAADVAEAIYSVPWVVLSFASVVIGVGSMITRWRRADDAGRRQLAWVMLALGLLLALTAVQVGYMALVEAGAELGLRGPIDLARSLAIAGVPVAIGIAVLHRGLYDVGRVVNRTIVYGALTAGVIAVYVAVVVGVGELVPNADDTGLALGATGLIAVAFDPARRAVQRLVNRLMFGQRDDPYAVLSRMGEVMAEAGSPDETLQAVVDTVAETLRLPWVAMELDQRDGQVTRAAHGPAEWPSNKPVSVPLVHRDERVGRLLAAPRSDHETLRQPDRRLLADIAHQAGAVAATARLTADLQHAREQLVLAREEERRRIRRDLHDGLGPSLAAQALALDAVSDRINDDPDVARSLLESLKEDTQELVGDIRRLVHDLRPPALDELGLAGALVAHVAQIDAAGDVAVRIRTDPDPLPELSAAVEVAAWRITREALTNVVRHAEATTCTVSLTIRGESLDVQVIDDGRGLPVVPRAGIGLKSMRDRAEELGGTLTAADAAGGGTIVQASLPASRMPAGRMTAQGVRHG